jgi:hypothetical protein
MALTLLTGNTEGGNLIASPQWRAQSDPAQGDTLGGLFQSWALGAQVFVDASGPSSGDRLAARGGIAAVGHLGFAYGLHAGFIFDPVKRNGVVYALGGDGDDPALHRRNAESYWRDYLMPMLSPGLPARPFRHTRDERSRLKVGYLCSDFRNHATAQLIAEMIERHDRSRFEIFALSLGADDGSAMRNVSARTLRSRLVSESSTSPICSLRS